MTLRHEVTSIRSALADIERSVRALRHVCENSRAVNRLEADVRRVVEDLEDIDPGGLAEGQPA